jgi:hypothetical protein
MSANAGSLFMSYDCLSCWFVVVVLFLFEHLHPFVQASLPSLLGAGGHGVLAQEEAGTTADVHQSV